MRFRQPRKRTLRVSIENIEEYVAREQNGETADPTAPRAAGA